jgi:aminoglycoside 3-N-acetyltransferase
MIDQNLFKSKQGTWITNGDVLKALEKSGAADTTILYIHSGLTLGLPNPAFSRSSLLECLFETISMLKVPTICMPAFTFSFCNGLDYNVQTSCSRMGALNEYVRKLPAAHRSIDPLMSTVVMGQHLDLVSSLGKSSIGETSTFDKLHRLGSKVKFAFIGTSVQECFTYTHYIEERLNVPYRYNRSFTGRIIDGDRTWTDTYSLFVRYSGVVPSSNGLLERSLTRSGALRVERCGDASISCVPEPEAYDLVVGQLNHDIGCYLDHYPRDRNTDFAARQMVSL